MPFQRSSGRLAKAGIKVGALSADDESTTAELIAKYGLTYAIGQLLPDDVLELVRDLGDNPAQL